MRGFAEAARDFRVMAPAAGGSFVPTVGNQPGQAAPPLMHQVVPPITSESGSDASDDDPQELATWDAADSRAMDASKPPGSLGGLREVHKRPPEPFSEDIYCLAIAIYIRDTFWHDKFNTPLCNLRLFRMALTQFFLGCCVGSQVWLMVVLNIYATTPNTREMQEKYVSFEEHMYMGRVRSFPGGFVRGEGALNRTQFHSLEDATSVAKGDVCQFPIAQPGLLFPVLLLWTLLILADIRSTVTLYSRLVVATPNIRHMRNALTRDHRILNMDHEALILGLTPLVKVAITGTTIVPRVALNLGMLYMGCHWLMGTTSHHQLVINSVALAFIGELKYLGWTAVPRRLQLETTGLHYMPIHAFEEPTWILNLDMFSMLFIAIVWVLLYIYVLQTPLPYYMWDLGGVCEPYLNSAEHMIVFD